MAKPLKNTIAVFIFCLLGCTQKTESSVLRLFTWSEYFDQQLIEKFSSETGIEVKMDYFASNEEMLTKIQLTSDGKGYDIIVPSDYMVKNLVDLNLLQPLDPKEIPFTNEFTDEGKNQPYDPGLKYTVPMAIGTTGLAWNKNLLPDLGKADISWKDFFTNPKFKGKVTLLDDVKEVTQAILLTEGKNLKTATAEDVEKAFELLKTYRPQIKGFTSETRPAIAGDECALCMAYSGDVRAVAKDKPEIGFILPTDGATIWTDNFSIPKNSSNPKAAYLFLRYLYQAEAAKEFTIRTGYRTFSKPAIALLPAEIAKDRIIFPTSPKAGFHFLVSRPDLTLLLDRQWAQVRSL